MHGALTVASFCPSVCGSAFSAADAGVYAIKGDKAGVAISLGAAAIGLASDAGAAKLAGTALKEAAAAAPAIAKEIKISGEAAAHAADAIKAGHPDVLTIDRAGAAANREAATGGLEKVPGKQLDEYPPAMFKEGGAGASVRPISPSDNMRAGACIGNACRGLPDGAQVRIVPEP